MEQMNAPLQVLVLDDSQPDAEQTLKVLEKAGLEVDWVRVETAESFSAALNERNWDVILADFTLRRLNVISALKILKESGQDIPFILVSTTLGEEAAVAGMRAGADDFFGKGRLGRLAPAVERSVRQARHRRERRRMSTEVRVLAERWRLLLQHVRCGVALHQAIWDDQGRLADFRYLEWNPEAEVILGLSRQQVLGRTGRELFPGIAERGLLDRYARVMTTGLSEEIQDCSTTDGRQERDIETSCFRLDSQHFATLFRDATDRKLAEKRLREYAAEVALVNMKLEKVNEELERRNRELEEFVHVASHDLQEPLRKVVSFGDLLARGLGENLDAKCSQYLGLMQDAARRLQRLIRDLLMMSRAGRAALHLEPTPLEKCVHVALGRLSARIAEAGARVELDPLPTLTIDPAQICQLYENLISNALVFRREQEPLRIRITCEETPEGPVLGVADNGIGIEPEFHDKIFQAFQRLHGRDKHDGSGIGLAVCRKIVSRNGGRIWVESRLGEGSHFRFILKNSELEIEGQLLSVTAE